MKKMNNKAFTLIELLSVIVILGVLMMSAIPAVTSAIARSRRNTFATNAKEIINSVRISLNSGEAITAQYNASGSTNAEKYTATAAKEECQFPVRQGMLKIYIPKEDLGMLLERGAKKSSFGRQYSDAFVYIYNKSSDKAEGDYYNYYIYILDNAKNGIDQPTLEDDITGAIIKIGKGSTAEPTTLTVPKSTIDPSTGKITVSDGEFDLINGVSGNPDMLQYCILAK